MNARIQTAADRVLNLVVEAREEMKHLSPRDLTDLLHEAEEARWVRVDSIRAGAAIVGSAVIILLEEKGVPKRKS